MQVLIINLSSATQRLAFQERQMMRLGLPYEVLRAISTQHLSEQAHRHLTLGWVRPLRLTELACYLSHQKAWQRVIDYGKPMLILEDDALLARSTPQLLHLLEKRPNCDLVSLETRKQTKWVGPGQPLTDSHRLLPLYQDSHSSAAYLLWPHTAKRLLTHSKQQAPSLISDFLDSVASVNKYQIEPAAAIQLSQCEAYQLDKLTGIAGIIRDEDKPLPTYARKKENLRFWFRQKVANTKRSWRQLHFANKSKKREIILKKEDFV